MTTSAPPPLKLLAAVLVPLLVPLVKVLSTPKRAARVFTRLLTDTYGASGVYYDESGHPMPGSKFVRDRMFQNRVVAETRALLAKLMQSAAEGTSASRRLCPVTAE